MQGIEFYLKKFEQFGHKERDLNKKIREVIYDICHIELIEKDISIQSGVLRVMVSGAGKSEIFLHRKEIEKRFSEIITIL